MFARIRQTVRGCPFGVRAGLFAAGVGGYLFLGWLVGDSFWREGGWGFIVVFFAGPFVYSGVTDRSARALYAWAIATFVAAVPVVYALDLIAQLSLSLLGYSHFHALELFVKSIFGVLIGVGAGILVSLKNTFSNDIEQSSKGRRERISSATYFQLEMRAFIPLAIGAALLMTIPAALPARIILSVFWGFFSAVYVVACTVLIDHDPAAGAWLFIIFAEGAILLVLIGLAVGHRPYEGLQLTGPAAVTCAAVYLVVWLWSAVAKWVAPTPATAPAPGNDQGMV